MNENEGVAPNDLHAREGGALGLILINVILPSQRAEARNFR